MLGFVVVSIIFGVVLLAGLSATADRTKELPTAQVPTPSTEALLGQIQAEGIESVAPSLSTTDIKTLVAPSQIALLNGNNVKILGSALVEKALSSGKNPERQVASALPSASAILAMLARDRDVDDYREHATEEGAAGSYYQNVVELVPHLKPLRTTYEALFAGFAQALDAGNRCGDPIAAAEEAAGYKSGVTLPRLSSKPRESEYDYSHTFALDIFLHEVKTNPTTGLEKGPLLFSLSESIVLATSSNWRGGEKLSEYHSGGITPKAGNGVILYSPNQRRFFLYFHLNDIMVKPGYLIPAGYPLGHGGNTGVNARKPGHGEHLHLEIYEASQGRFLRNYEIAEVVF
jgi:murein DD-endopeptidase MepM/ murein hydrolase activator NlpD